MTVRFLTKAHLVSLRKLESSRGARFNRAVSDSFLNSLSEKTRLPILWTMLHNDVEIRAAVTVNEQGNVALIDMPFSVFESLPTAEV